MNPDGGYSDAMFQVMKDGEWVELPKASEILNTEINKNVKEAMDNPKYSGGEITLTIMQPKLNQYFFDCIRKDFGFPTNNYLKFHGIKMRRRR